MKTVLVNNHSGGMTSDPRDNASGVHRIVTGFDIGTNPHKLTPYKSSVSGDNDSANSKKQNFCVAALSGNVNAILSLGVKTGTTKAEVLYKALTTNVNHDLSDDLWSASANNQSATGATNFELFVYYARKGKVYGARDGTHIWAYATAATAWSDDIITADGYTPFTYTNIAQGLVHSKDDILYIPYDNKICSNNNGVWNTTALTLPSYLYITSICEYGNYLAIACANLDGVSDSVVYLWDRDSSLSTLSESIDWGQGVLKIIETIEGRLVGVSLVPGGAPNGNDRVMFKFYDVARGAVTFNQIICSTSSNTLTLRKQKVNNTLYFLAKLTIAGTLYEGLFAVGFFDNTGRFAVWHERPPQNNSTNTAAQSLKGFYNVNGYTFVAYINDSGGYTVYKTDSSANYTYTSAVETCINPNMPEMDKTSYKQLMAVQVSFPALTSGQQVVVKYRVDSNDGTAGSWTTIATASTVGQVALEMPKASSSEFTAGRDYEFRIESTGGAEVTSLKYSYNILNTLI